MNTLSVHVPQEALLKSDERPTLVFVTVRGSTGSRSLAEARVHSIIKDVWFNADYWEIGTYVLMPDHLHFLAWPGCVEFDFGQVDPILEVACDEEVGQIGVWVAKMFISSHNPLL
jgi:hypothetical protein